MTHVCQSSPCRSWWFHGSERLDAERDWIEMLCEALRGTGARMTIDSERNASHPCFCCGETEKPRDLVRVGVWTRRVGGRGSFGDAIQRPVCEACRIKWPEETRAEKATEPRGMPDEVSQCHQWGLCADRSTMFEEWELPCGICPRRPTE